MLSTNNLWLFLIATLTLNITPGPDMLYIIARAVGQGRAAGIVSALGIATGCFVHTLAVAFGLASLMLVIPIAYEVVKYLGAAYLIYLGIRTLTNRQEQNGGADIKKDSLAAIFLQGVVTNVLNPKVAFFFLAFLPQFVNNAQGNVAWQIICLGILFNTSGTFVNISVALITSRTKAHFKTHIKNSFVFRWLTGIVFIGLGVRLALLERR